MIWQAPWWAYLVAIGMMAGMGFLMWSLLPFMVQIGAVLFCIVYPGCHFQ